MLTIFTPTYNRRELLERAYNSLQGQSEFNFEWLIIDDGSSDHTGELCEKWIRGEQKFPIRYFYQSNSGKCAAINKALNLAQGEWFLVLDSDDFLSDDAVEKINRWTDVYKRQVSALHQGKVRCHRVLSGRAQRQNCQRLPG